MLVAGLFFGANDFQTLPYLVERYAARLRFRDTLGLTAPSDFERIELASPAYLLLPAGWLGPDRRHP